MDANVENKEDKQVTNEFITVTVAADKVKEFTGKDGKKYCSIDAGQGYSYVRPKEQLHESVRTADSVYFSVPENFAFTLKRSRTDGQGGFVPEELKVSAQELKERHQNFDNATEFVRITISAKRVVSSFTSSKSGTPVEYSKVLAPEGMTYIRKSEQIHDDKYNEGKKYFMMPKGQEITMEYRTENIIGYTQNDSKPIYETKRITVTGERLKEMYDDEKRRLAEKSKANENTIKEERAAEENNPFIEVKDNEGREQEQNFRRHIR